MKNEKAIEILKAYNKWRRDVSTKQLKMQPPELIGEAIDTAIAELTAKLTERPFEWPIPEGWQVKTRGGEEVKHLTEFPEVDNGCILTCIVNGIYNGYDINGINLDNYSNPSRNLILVKKTRTIWVVEWPDGLIVGTSVKADAEDEYNDAVRSDMHGGEPTIREVAI